MYYGTGLQGTHSGIWHSLEAEEYAKKIEKELISLEAKKGEKLTGDELATFYKNVDHRLYSEVNGELIELIFETFEEGLNK